VKLRNRRNKFKILHKEFNTHFRDIRKYEATISSFSMPFDVNVETITVDFQMEMTNLQCDTELRNKCQHVRLLDFCKHYLPVDKFPVLSDYGRRTSFFGNMYVCEKFFSKMKVLKRKSRNRLDDERLQRYLRVAMSHILPKIDNVMAKKRR
jgi:hypothetical protein